MDEEYNFTNHEINLGENSKIYLTSDGFVDQIGTNGKKFGTKRFKEIISQNKSLNEINSELKNEFDAHIGDEDQRDDITILGLEF